MNWDRIESDLRHAKWNVAEQQDNLADDQIAAGAGRRKHYAREMRGTRAIAMHAPERQLSDWAYPRNVKDRFR